MACWWPRCTRRTATRSPAQNSRTSLPGWNVSRAHAAELYAAGVPVVLAGDYNVVPTDRDIYPTKSYAKNALIQPESRAAVPAHSRPGLGRRRSAPCIPMRRCTRSGTTCEIAGRAMPGCASIICFLSAESAERLVGAGRGSRGPWQGRRKRPCTRLGGAARPDESAAQVCARQEPQAPQREHARGASAEEAARNRCW